MNKLISTYAQLTSLICLISYVGAQQLPLPFQSPQFPEQQEEEILPPPPPEGELLFSLPPNQPLDVPSPVNGEVFVPSDQIQQPSASGFSISPPLSNQPRNSISIDRSPGPRTSPIRRDSNITDTRRTNQTNQTNQKLPQGDGIRLNFKEAPLSEVLNYLSEAAGFVIVQETPVSGTVTITSHSPLSKDEVIDLLNAVLVDKGYAIVAIGRILKVVPRDQAAQYPVPVKKASTTPVNPAEIPVSEEVVTQILPVRYLDVTRLLQALQPLLPPTAKVSADQASNALIMTDTQINIRRIAEIIHALDTSVGGITTIKVFPLVYADATEVAQIINQLFQQQQTGARGQQQGFMPPFMRFGGGPQGPQQQQQQGDSPARTAASRVVAAADQNTNSVIVVAPEDLMSTIEALIIQIDNPGEEPLEIRSFRLQNADAVETASLINELFSTLNTSTSTTYRGGGRFMGPMMIGGTTTQSSRRQRQQIVVAVGDPRTNTLIVSASRDMMIQIAELIGRLDSDTSRKQQVYVYSLEHADPSSVASILEEMFQQSRTGSRTSTRTTSRTGTTSTLQQRQQSGANLSGTLGSTFGSGTSSRTPSR